MCPNNENTSFVSIIFVLLANWQRDVFRSASHTFQPISKIYTEQSAIPETGPDKYPFSDIMGFTASEGSTVVRVQFLPVFFKVHSVWTQEQPFVLPTCQAYRSKYTSWHWWTQWLTPEINVLSYKSILCFIAHFCTHTYVSDTESTRIIKFCSTLWCGHCMIISTHHKGSDSWPFRSWT